MILHPAIPFFIAASLVFALPKKTIIYVAALAGILSIYLLCTLTGGEEWKYSLSALNLTYLKVHELSRVFAIPTIVFFILSLLFNHGRTKRREYFAALVSAGTTIAVYYAGDFLTALIMLETITLFSLILITAKNFELSKFAALKYFIIHFMGAAIISAGIAINILYNQSISIANFAAQDLSEPKNLGVVIILLGLLINIGLPPFSSWLVEAYPKATFHGTAYLNLFFTKAIMFLLLTCFAGSHFLIYPGVLMIAFGFAYILFERNLRKMICLLIVAQAGMFLCIATINSPIIFYYVLLNHFTYISLILFIISLTNIEETEMRFFKLADFMEKEALIVLYSVFLVAIFSFPMTSGFLYKSLLDKVASHEIIAVSVINFILLGFTIVYRMPYVISNPAINLRKRINKVRVAALSGVATMCFLPAFFKETGAAIVGLSFTEDYFSSAVLFKQVAIALIALGLFIFGKRIFYISLKLPELNDFLNQAVKFISYITPVIKKPFWRNYRFVSAKTRRQYIKFVTRMHLSREVEANTTALAMILCVILGLVIFINYIS